MKKTIAVIVLIAVAIAGFFGFKELSKTLNSTTPDAGGKKTNTPQQPKQEKAAKLDAVVDSIELSEEYKEKYGSNILKNFMLEAKTVVYQAGNQHRDFRNLAIYNNIWGPRYSKYFPWLVGQDLVNKIAKTL